MRPRPDPAQVSEVGFYHLTTRSLHWALAKLLDNEDITNAQLCRYVKGPDFPTGAQILGRQGIIDAYKTGKGSIKVRAIAEIEEAGRETRIVVSEFPYEVSPEAVEERIADLVKSGDLDGISAVTNESAGRKSRLVVKLKRDANANVVLNKIFKNTQLQTSFAVNMLALVDGVPRTLNLLQRSEEHTSELQSH